MIPLVLLYLCCLATGLSLERRLAINALVHRVIVVFTIASAQLMLCVQALSLVGRLTGVALLALNAAFTLVVALVTRRRRSVIDRLPWKELLVRARSQITAARPSFWVCALLIMAAASLLGRCLLGATIIPLGDVYHFEMPLYWVQNHSIAPFPVNNPRITAVSFLGEALAMPGYLYARSGFVFVLLTLFASFVVLGIVFCLARHLGCSVGASWAAAALSAGLPDFAMTLLTERASTYLHIMWATASMLFLLDSRPGGVLSSRSRLGLACSIFCFIMACGSKNSLSLASPFYLLAAFVALNRSLLEWRFLRSALLSGLLGLLCSGVVWNYSANKAWFGSFAGPPFLQSFVSRDFHPQSVWTRVLRGATLVAADTLYVPQAVRPAYVSVVQSTVKILGGRGTLKEDNEFFSFGDKAIAPLKGLGLVGLVFLIPGAGIGLWRCARRDISDLGRAECVAAAVLLLTATGCFVMVHAFFRWQWLGLARLIPALGLLAAPLSGFVLERRFPRMMALGLLLASTAFFLLYDLSFVGRRIPSAEYHPVFKYISRFTRDHTAVVSYSTEKGQTGQLRIREDYTQREILLKALERIPSGSVVGFAGDENFESYFLFGRRLENKVVPLSDAREPGLALEPAAGVEYVVFGDGRAERKTWAAERKFDLLFETHGTEQTAITVFRRLKDR